MNGVVQTPACALRQRRTPAHDVPTIARDEPLPPTERPNCGERTKRLLAATTLEHKNESETSRHAAECEMTRVHPLVPTDQASQTNPDSASTPCSCLPCSSLPGGSLDCPGALRPGSGRTSAPLTRSTRPARQRKRGPRDGPDPTATTRLPQIGPKKRAPPGVPGGAHEAGGDLLSRGAVSSATRA